MTGLSEHAIQNAVRLAASAAGLTLFRNNVGLGWAGDCTRLPDGSILIRNARPFHAGLCLGSSDLIGWRPVVVTAEMVGETLAQFAAVEVKAPRGRLSTDQRRFLTRAREAGAYAIVARSAEDLA